MFRELYFILLLCAIEISSQNNETKFEGVLVRQLEELRKSIFDEFVESNNTCGIDVSSTLEALQRGELWAIKMIDASPKLQSGFLEGNLCNFGSYDECLAVEGKSQNKTIKGKYCNFFLFFTNDSAQQVSHSAEESLHMFHKISVLESICMPDSCNIEDLQYAFNLTAIPGVQPWIDNRFCHVKSYKNEFTPLHGVFLFIVSLLICVMIIATSYDLYLRKHEKKLQRKMLISFSLYTNFKRLIKVNSDSDHLACINGIRTLSMAWIIIGHRYFSSSAQPNLNSLHVLEWVKGFSYALTSTALFAVDSFFLLSGLLIMYLFLTATSRGYNFNLIVYYIHRMIRLWPALAMLILFFLTYVKDLSIELGPAWKPAYATLYTTCKKNWWYSMLFLQNTIRWRDVCLGHTWYLAVDSQLYTMAPLLFLPIRKWPKPTVIVMIILIIISNLYTFLVVWYKKMNGTRDVTKYYNIMYGSPIVRSSGWTIGCLLGYALFKTKGQKIVIPKLIVIILWILSISGFCLLIYMQSYIMNQKYNRLIFSIYLGFSKTVWCASLSWIIFACVHGYSGYINSFLSNQVFTVIGRVTYSMYLSHMVILYFQFIRLHGPGEFSDYNTLYLYWADFLYTFLFSLVWCLCFESPFIAFTRVLLTSERSKKLNKNEENEVANEERIEYNTRL